MQAMVLAASDLFREGDVEEDAAAPLVLLSGHVCALSSSTTKAQQLGDGGGLTLKQPYAWQSDSEASAYLLPRWLWHAVEGETVSTTAVISTDFGGKRSAPIGWESESVRTVRTVFQSTQQRGFSLVFSRRFNSLRWMTRAGRSTKVTDSSSRTDSTLLNGCCIQQGHTGCMWSPIYYRLVV